MAYNVHRFATLERLGIEQLPALVPDPEFEFFSTALAIRERPVPGKRCPQCAARGQTIWVIPGKRCPQCRAEVN
ncbi:hypothetical protein MBLNU230_g4625t1 [Neophaeotheca triangularis]